MRPLSAVFVLLGLISCSSAVPPETVLQEVGDRVIVHAADAVSMKGELICVDDSSLVVQREGTTAMYSFPARQVTLVVLDTSLSRPWLLPVIVEMGIPSLVLIIAAEDAREVGLLAVAVTALTAYLFESSEPTKTFPFPLTQDKLETLRHHARFAYGLSASQRDEIGVVPFTALN